MNSVVELKDAVLNKIDSMLASGDREDAFMVCDVDDVRAKVEAWRRLLPRVEPFYAVKCHSDDQFIKAMIDMGLGFDCASLGEMAQVMRLGLNDPSRIIYAHPCKPRQHVEFARKTGVRMMTFDNHDELRKIQKLHPDAQVVLRLLPDDFDAVCRLGQKFGASMQAVPSLLALVKELNMDMIGFSFHVGSGCKRLSAYADAVRMAREAFDIAESMGMKMHFLDIGGGFPGHAISEWVRCETDKNIMMFPNVADVLRPVLDECFPEGCGVRIIAEPGRYMVMSSCALMVNVVARRVNENAAAEEEEVRYYVNDGVYGSFNCIIYDHQEVSGFPLNLVKRGSKKGDNRVEESTPVSEKEVVVEEQPEQQVVTSRGSIWGPTCDGLDCIMKGVELPVMEIGDWMVFPNTGAYTVAAAAPFNGFEVTLKYYVNV